MLMGLAKQHTVSVFEEIAAVEEKRQLPIYSVFTEEKVVSLTFDVAWGAEDIDEVLATLDSYDIKATFFLVGDWMRKYPDEVKKIAELGHDIASHSDKHPHMSKMTKDQIKADILAAHATIKELLGIECDLFRAPYGEYNNAVVQGAKECGYYTIQWDVDSLDWKEYGKEPLIQKVLTNKNLGPGSIILLHTGTKYTKDALAPIIEGLQAKGYKMVPISQLILRENYTLDHTGRQYGT
jgi:polysaccharide deacetylase family sporulation protein PdaB